jgi:hypothetical protein
MRVVIDAFWDEEAQVWVASSREDLGIVTEAPTIEALQDRLAAIVPDFLADVHPGPFEIELLARSLQTVAA